ncbi:MAG: sel1 repeat family protein [Alphaproteobacteria bacterium]|nr:sel1 repeat family protein [Alphaproteobacteria bacterium]
MSVVFLYQKFVSIFFAVFMKLIIYFLVAILIFSSARAENFSPAFDEITLERTRCFGMGRCPAYKVVISGSGKVTYTGENFVKKVGIYTTTLLPQQVSELNQALREADYFSIPERVDCRMYATDQAGIITSVTINGAIHKIPRDTGCSDWPAKIRAFETNIEKIVNITQWRGPHGQLDKDVAKNIHAYMEPQSSESVDNLRQKAESGDTAAQYAMGVYYEIDNSHAEAAEWFSKAGNQGHGKSSVLMARLCDEGVVNNCDYKDVARWWRKAAYHGNKDAQGFIGVQYFKGDGFQIKPDYREAYFWLLLADKSPVMGPEPFYQGEVDVAAAASHLTPEQKAEVEARVKKWAPMPKTLEEQAKWLEQMAQQGNAHDKFLMGQMYVKGIDVPQNYEMAAKLFLQSAELGDAEAQDAIGRLYLTGQGVSQDYSSAAKWLEKAAKQNWYSSMYDLGKLYASGQGVKKNDERAWFWLAFGNSHLSERDEIGKRLSPERLKELFTLVNSCLGRIDRCQQIP